MTQNPIVLLARAFWIWMQGRVRIAVVSNADFIEEKGEAFLPFRKICVKAPRGRNNPVGAVFKVRFRFKNLSAVANRRLSVIPIPLIVAQPGFRSKTWFLGEKTGDFIGYYEFETVGLAEAYWNSLPLKMMRRRAAEGSLTHEINRTSANDLNEPNRELNGAST